MSLFLAPDENRVWFYLNLTIPSQRSTQSGFMSMASATKLKFKKIIIRLKTAYTQKDPDVFIDQTK